MNFEEIKENMNEFLKVAQRFGQTLDEKTYIKKIQQLKKLLPSKDSIWETPQKIQLNALFKRYEHQKREKIEIAKNLIYEKIKKVREEKLSQKELINIIKETQAQTERKKKDNYSPSKESEFDNEIKNIDWEHNSFQPQSSLIY